MAVVESPFGAPGTWRDDDLIAVSRHVDGALVVEAYRSGVFPMPIRRGVMGWFSPVVRGILPLDGLRVSRSLSKSLRHFEIRTDSAFDQVLDRCGDPRRPGAWIDRDIRRLYRQLHADGVVHSVEAWRQGRLAGGLYGVSLGGLFAGESMFHDPEIGRDASKAALVALVKMLRAAGDADCRLLDVQWRTPHLASLGVVEISRPAYLSRLGTALALAPPQW